MDYDIPCSSVFQTEPDRVHYVYFVVSNVSYIIAENVCVIYVHNIYLYIIAKNVCVIHTVVSEKAFL